MAAHSKSKNKWKSKQISKKFKKQPIPKPRTNNAVYCQCIHLPRLQFQLQDYQTIIPPTKPNHTTHSLESSIDHINELITTFTTKLPPKRIHIVHISDTHLSYNNYLIPFKKNMLNILIHSGDLSHSGCLNVNGAIPKHFKQFNQWLTQLPHHKKIIIAGNHDIAFRQLGKNKIHSMIFNNNPNIIYLQDDMINLYGMNIYGTPWTNKGAFKPNKGKGRCKKQEELIAKWKQIPNALNILISHQHPTVFSDDGDENLLDEVVGRVMPNVHLFGHDHSNIGWKVYEDIMFVNSAMDKYAIPHVFDVVFDL